MLTDVSLVIDAGAIVAPPVREPKFTLAHVPAGLRTPQRVVVTLGGQLCPLPTRGTVAHLACALAQRRSSLICDAMTAMLDPAASAALIAVSIEKI